MKKIINVKNNQFQNVLKKAIETKPLVRARPSEPGVFNVRASAGDFYTVVFWRENGECFGECECRAAEKNFYCYHFAAALMLHSFWVDAGILKPAQTFSGRLPAHTVLPEIAEAMRLPVAA